MKKTIRIPHTGLRLVSAAVALAAMSGCFLFESGEDNGDGYIYEPVTLNDAPVVAVSVSSTRVLLDETVSVSGEGSYDPEGSGITYRWEFVVRPEGSIAAVSGADQMVASFVADVAGEYQIRLTVSDGDLSSSGTEWVRAYPLPTITGLDPTSGVAGTVVKIIGTDISWDFLEDAVFFNGVEATVTGLTSTWLVMAAPASTTGPVVLSTMGHTVEGPIFVYEDDEPQFGVNLLGNPSFETAPLIGWLPDVAGVWQGDVTQSVGADDTDAAADGITPVAGDRMLKFVSSTVGAASPQWNSSETFQIVDLRRFDTEIAEGDVVIDAEAQFNRVTGDAETDARFGLVVRAYAGNPDTFHDQWRAVAHLAHEAVAVIHDQPGTWVQRALEMTLPAETGFVLVWLTAIEDVVNDGEAPEFDGHFADAARLVVRQP